MVASLILIVIYRFKKNSFYLYQLFMILSAMVIVLAYNFTFDLLGLTGGKTSPAITSFGGISLVVGVALFGYYFSKRPISILEEMNLITSNIAKGDLTSNPTKSLRGFKEFQELVKNVKNTVTTLTETIKAITETADEVNNNALNMTASAEEVNASSEEITSIAQQITKGSQDQADRLAVAMNEATDLQNIFNNEIKHISNTAEIIKSLSGQVNILALNASIEAARAGEYGRGFAVVAENIRMLAENTKASVEEVNNTVNSMQGSLSSAISKIINSIDSVSSISEDTVAGAEESSAATEQQAASMQEITAAAQEQLKAIESLRSYISTFKYE